MAHTEVRVPADILVQEVGGESVLLNLKSGVYFGMNAVGTSIWHAVTTAPNVQTAIHGLLDEFDVEPDRLQADVYDLVGKWAENGLVELV